MTGAKLSANRINGCRASCTRVWRDKIATAGYTATVTHQPTTKRTTAPQHSREQYTEVCEIFTQLLARDRTNHQLFKNNCVKKFIQGNKYMRDKYVSLIFIY